MSSGLVLALILLAVLAGSLYFFIRAEGGLDEIPRLLERVGITLPSTPPPQPTASRPPAPPEFSSGNSRFSRGTCSSDSECVAAGCSGEVCSSDPNVITTCEFSDSFPNVQGYACSCLQTSAGKQGVCGWR